MGYSFVIVIVYVTNLLSNAWAFNTIVVASDGRRVATCRIERSGFEPWPGAALRCVLGQVTLLSQCLSPPRCINGVPANLMLGVALRWPGIQSG